MKKGFLILLLLISTCAGSYSQVINGQIIADTSNLTVVKLWGNHYERGFAYGYLLSSKIMQVWNNVVVPTYGALLPLASSIVNNPADFRIDSIYVVEAKAMVDGLGAAGVDTSTISYKDVFVVNFMTDLSGFAKYKSFDTQNCSSLMDWGAATTGTDLNGHSVIAHFLDSDVQPSSILLNQVMVVHIPSETNEQPWLFTGIAGQMVASQAINNSGLSAFLNTVDSFTAQNNKAYEPLTLTIRKAIESLDYNNDGLTNVNDMVDAINSNTNGFAHGYIVSSLAPSTAGPDSLIAIVAELAPATPYITYRNIVYSDTLTGDNLYAANNMIKRNDARQYCSRYWKVSSEIDTAYNGQNIGSLDNWNIMKTKSTQSTNLQFMQFIPENRIFNVAVSDHYHHAYQKPFITFYLDDLFAPAGINELKYSNKQVLTIYPNPANDELQLELANSTSLQKFEISDLLGRIIFKSTIDKKATVNISGLANGVYLIKLFSTNSAVIVKKFIKQ
jgi:hypothetical protein